MSQGHPREPRYYKWCTLSDSQVKNENKQNCVNFKRKYGDAPIKPKTSNFMRWSKEQWEHHNKIIVFLVATTLAIISILIAKGML